MLYCLGILQQSILKLQPNCTNSCRQNYSSEYSSVLENLRFTRLKPLDRMKAEKKISINVREFINYNEFCVKIIL